MRRKLVKWLLKMLQVSATVTDDQSSLLAQSVSSRAAMISIPIGDLYEPDKEFEEIATRAVMNPVYTFEQAVAKGRAKVKEAWLFEGKFDQRGRLLESDLAKGQFPYRIRHVESHEQFVESTQRAEREFRELPYKIKTIQEAERKMAESKRALMEEMKLSEDAFSSDQDTGSQYDSGQYTEFTPTYGGPFNKQLYLSDYLTMHARSFEAKNHNPIAKRIIDVMIQYAFGRRFKVRVRDDKKKKAWDDYEKKHNITHKMSKFWGREFLTYGEFMLDKDKVASIDPSTVWDIITNPDDITEVYYYYQSYPTAYQMYTGIVVPGAPGSAKQAPIEYIIRQLPDKQVIHIKGNCVSQEKRGRSILFPVLGWCKRMKDLYNAQVMRSQLEATFVWDDTITGSEADIQSHLARYAKLPVQPTAFVHNEKVVRQSMPAIGTAGGNSSSKVGAEILALIATGIGIPKDFFNIMGGSGSGGSGNRATALVGAEPFEKVVQELQAEFEKLGLQLAEMAITDAGLDYEPGDVEFIFPSVTKDTTTETLKNISLCETMQYIDHQMAAEMAAVEMDVTGYDYDEVQDNIKARQEEMPPTPGMAAPGMPGQNPQAPNQPKFPTTPNGVVKKDMSPIHGAGKVALKGQLNNL